MGWFKKKEQPVEWPKSWMVQGLEKHRQMLVGQYQLLNAFRKRGETFNYLGIEMLVVDFQKRIGDNTYPAIVAEYVDKNGVIRQAQFHPNMLPILEAENPEVME